MEYNTSKSHSHQHRPHHPQNRILTAKWSQIDRAIFQIYAAVEEDDFWSRCFFGSSRPFDMKVLDFSGREVIHLYRHLSMCRCCFTGWLQKVDISSPPDVPIGTVEQVWSCAGITYVLKDAHEEPVLRIEGPSWTFDCCRSVVFKVITTAKLRNGESVKLRTHSNRSIYMHDNRLSH